jgi:hypothetical protein
MEDKAKIISEVATLLTYVGSAMTILFNFLNTYSLAFGVIFAGITCCINWRVQRIRVKLMLSKQDDDI